MFQIRQGDSDTIVEFAPLSLHTMTIPFRAPLLNGRQLACTAIANLTGPVSELAHLICADHPTPHDLIELLGLSWRIETGTAPADPHTILQQWKTPHGTLNAESPIWIPGSDPQILLTLDASHSSRLRPQPSPRDLVALRLNINQQPEPAPLVSGTYPTYDWYSYRVWRLFHLMTGQSIEDAGVDYARYLFTIRNKMLSRLLSGTPPTLLAAQTPAIQAWALRHQRSLADPNTWGDAQAAAQECPDLLVEVEHGHSPTDPPVHALAVPLSHDPAVGLLDAVVVTTTDAHERLCGRWIAWLHPLRAGSTLIPLVLDRLTHLIQADGPPLSLTEGPLTAYLPCHDPSCFGLQFPAGPAQIHQCLHSIEPSVLQWNPPSLAWSRRRSHRNQWR